MAHKNASEDTTPAPAGYGHGGITLAPTDPEPDMDLRRVRDISRRGPGPYQLARSAGVLAAGALGLFAAQQGCDIGGRPPRPAPHQRNAGNMERRELAARLKNPHLRWVMDELRDHGPPEGNQWHRALSRVATKIAHPFALDDEDIAGIASLSDYLNRTGRIIPPDRAQNFEGSSWGLTHERYEGLGEDEQREWRQAHADAAATLNQARAFIQARRAEEAQLAREAQARRPRLR